MRWTIQNRVIEALRREGPLSAQGVAQALKTSRVGSILTVLEGLVAEGALLKEGAAYRVR